MEQNSKMSLSEEEIASRSQWVGDRIQDVNLDVNAGPITVPVSSQMLELVFKWAAAASWEIHGGDKWLQQDLSTKLEIILVSFVCPSRMTVD